MGVDPSELPPVTDDESEAPLADTNDETDTDAEQ